MNLATLFCHECIPYMPPFDYGVWLALAILATTIALHRTYRNFKRARLVEDMPTSKIRSASQGFTELIGVAHLQGDPLIAPLTGSECLWWFYRIEKYRSTGKSSHWVTVETQTSPAPFYLRDTTGICRVDPKGAEIASNHRKVWHGSTQRPRSASGTTAGHLRMGGLSSIGSLSLGRRYRYTEVLIKEGDPIYTLGHFETDKGGQRTLSPEHIAANILRHWKQDFGKLVEQYDRNGDGKLDLKEWQLVQQAAHKAALARQRENALLPQQHSLSKPLDASLPFIIGSQAQVTLVKKYRWKAIGYAVGFLAAGTLTGWLVSARFFGVS